MKQFLDKYLWYLDATIFPFIVHHPYQTIALIAGANFLMSV